MNEWIRFSRGQLTYARRITRAPFNAWAETPQGAAVVAAIAAQIRFSFLGRERAARGRLWRELAAAARDEAVVNTIQREVDAYLDRLSQLAYGEGLPRTGVELHRLVVVPRVLLNAAAYHSTATRLTAQPAMAALEGGEPLREFF